MKVFDGIRAGSVAGREAYGIPVRQSVGAENVIVSLPDGASAAANMMQGARSDRTYRFQFPFGTLTGFKNGDRSRWWPCPATDIVKVHKTFAPRFEDLEYGLANGGLLLQGGCIFGRHPGFLMVLDSSK